MRREISSYPRDSPGGRPPPADRYPPAVPSPAPPRPRSAPPEPACERRELSPEESSLRGSDERTVSTSENASCGTTAVRVFRRTPVGGERHFCDFTLDGVLPKLISARYSKMADAGFVLVRKEWFSADRSVFET